MTPGGWIELCDPTNPLVSDDGTFPEDSALMKWNRLWHEASVKVGAPLDSAKRYKQQLVDAGYQNVKQEEYKLPLNTWPKDPKYKEIGESQLRSSLGPFADLHLGAWNCFNLNSGLQALSLMLFTAVLGWQAIEVETFLVDVRKDLKNRAFHVYWPV